MLYLILTLVLVALDQAVKYLVRTNIPLGGHVPFLPHVLELTYVQNTGAAFSMLSEHTWLLSLLSAAVVVALAAVLLRQVFTHPLGVVPAVLVIAGGLGNLIDRVALGYVTDMFNTLFMRFAVFNVADIFITVGGVLLVIYLLFFYEKLECRKEGGHDQPNLPADRG